MILGQETHPHAPPPPFSSASPMCRLLSSWPAHGEAEEKGGGGANSFLFAQDYVSGLTPPMLFAQDPVSWMATTLASFPLLHISNHLVTTMPLSHITCYSLSLHKLPPPATLFSPYKFSPPAYSDKMLQKFSTTHTLYFHDFGPGNPPTCPTSTLFLCLTHVQAAEQLACTW